MPHHRTNPSQAPEAIPIDPRQLVAAAEEFAEDSDKDGQARPRPTWLRQAVSTAYYAIYHDFSRAAASHLLPNGGGEDQLKIARLFRHNAFKGVCATIAGRDGAKSNPYLDPISRRLRQTSILDVASAFCDLQEARHKADYDHLEPFSSRPP